MGMEPSKDVRRVPTEQEPPPSQEDKERCSDDFNVDAKRLSDYKREGKLKWNNQQSNNRQPARQSPPNQCGGCGAKGERMHPRDSCPARSLVFYVCGKTGHYKSVCRSHQISQSSPGTYNDVQCQRYYRPPTSYQPPQSYLTSQKMVRVNEVHEGQADPMPMMHNIIVIPHEGSQPFEFEARPDTGCTKMIIARNLAIPQGMGFNPDSTLKIRAVNAQRLDNSGSVTFTLRYQGRSIEVNALVSDAIKDEILLSWGVLKNLGVIDSTFPNVKHPPVRAAKTMSTGSFAHIETDADAKAEVSNLMGEYKQVFQIDSRL